MVSEREVKDALKRRRKIARDLIRRCENDWHANDELGDLIQHRWAIVTERDDDSWVNGIDSAQDIADHERGCLTGTEGYDEWIEGVYDLDTGEVIAYKTGVYVTVQLADEFVVSSTVQVAK